MLSDICFNCKHHTCNTTYCRYRYKNKFRYFVISLTDDILLSVIRIKNTDKLYFTIVDDKNSKVVKIEEESLTTFSNRLIDIVVSKQNKVSYERTIYKYYKMENDIDNNTITITDSYNSSITIKMEDVYINGIISEFRNLSIYFRFL